MISWQVRETEKEMMVRLTVVRAAGRGSDESEKLE